ncbi:10476_t:CDS:1, partial [Cetraspora pellucida]
SNEQNNSISIAETLAAKFNNSTRNNKLSHINSSHVISPLVVPLSVNPLSVTSSSVTSSSITPLHLTSSPVTPSPVIKSSSLIKLIKSSFKGKKPYTQTRSCRKLTDLAKEALTNSDDVQPE